MEETALPHRSATLAPPPLETAASGTRALQRFDLGRTRAKPRVVQLAEPKDELIVSTVKMSVPD